MVIIVNTVNLVKANLSYRQSCGRMYR